MITESLLKVFQYIDTYRERMIDDLRESIAFKSISGSFEYNEELQKMVKWTENWLKKLKPTTLERFDIGSYTVDGKMCKLPTVILAKFGNDNKKKTVCVYCRMDVKSAVLVSNSNNNNNKSNSWQSDPWQLIEKNGLLYGRGSCKGKVPLMNWLHCIESFQQQRIPLPVNLKFIIEGMYEMNSIGLEAFLYTQRITFLKNIDYVCVNESEWLNKTIPCLSYGTCGICQYELIVSPNINNNNNDKKNNNNNNSSSNNNPEMGTIEFNATTILEYILNNCVDKLGNILIPKINDDVAQITPEGEKSLDDVICDLTLITRNLPEYMQCWSKQKILMRLWRLPTLLAENDSNEIDCKCTSNNNNNNNSDNKRNDKTIIGDVGGSRGDKSKIVTTGLKRKFLLKIVPVQTPDRCNLFVMDHIQKLIELKYKDSKLKIINKISKDQKKLQCTIMNNNNEIGLIACNQISATRPWKENSVSEHYEAAKRAVKNVFKEQPNMIRESVDIPIILVLQKIIGKNILLMPLSNNEQDDNFANECISMRNYFEGKKLLAAYLFQVAAIK